MGREFKDKDLYAFAVATIRVKETTLLGDTLTETLINADSVGECLQLLEEKGWGPAEDGTGYEGLLKAEKEKLWDLMQHLLNKEQLHYFDMFKCTRDYHNLKAAIKEAYTQKEYPGVYMEDGDVPAAKLKAAAADNDFVMIPSDMARVGAEARDILFSTGDSQLCDVVIDKAALTQLYKAGKSSGNALLEGYAELKCAAADINIAVRACRAGKSADFMQRAFAECDSISVNALANAARGGMDALFEYLGGSSYADAAAAIKAGSFDKWCDDRIIELARPQKYNAFTISPVIAYYIAKEMEIKSVRIILSGKANRLDGDRIRERIRASYV